MLDRLSKDKQWSEVSVKRLMRLCVSRIIFIGCEWFDLIDLGNWREFFLRMSLCKSFSSGCALILISITHSLPGMCRRTAVLLLIVVWNYIYLILISITHSLPGTERSAFCRTTKFIYLCRKVYESIYI